MRYKPEIGTVIKRSRAYYVTVPKKARLQMNLVAGERVRVEYDSHYDQIIVSRENKENERIPFRG